MYDLFVWEDGAKNYTWGGAMRHIAAIFVKNLRGKMTVGTFPLF